MTLPYGIAAGAFALGLILLILARLRGRDPRRALNLMTVSLFIAIITTAITLHGK